MDAPVENKMYEKLPLIYSYLMRKVDYSTWAKYLFTLVREGCTEDSKALELGAGNCKLADHLSGCFPDLIATDISRYMLFSNKNKFYPKVCCDMSALPFKSKFEIIYCTFDSVNYLTSKKKLFKLFKEAANCLSGSGVFTFDASLEKNSFIYTKVPERNGIYKGIKFRQVSVYNPATRIHKNTFTIKLRTGEVFSEVHKQKIYPFETYFELLEKAGLAVSNCYKAFSYKDGSGDSERVQFITRRIKK